MLDTAKCPKAAPLLCSPISLGPGSLLLVPGMEHLAKLEGRGLVGELRHRKASPLCTFCALEFHSPTPCPQPWEACGNIMTWPPPRTKSKLDWGGGHRLVPSYGLAAGNGFHCYVNRPLECGFLGPGGWPCSHFQKCFDSGL